MRCRRLQWSTVGRGSIRVMRRSLWLWLWLGLAVSGQACGIADVAPTIDRDAIRVWSCHEADQPLRSFTAETTVRSSLSALVALLMDTAAAPQWVYRTERMQLLRKDAGSGSFTLRAETNFWPLRDRDVVVAGRVHQDPATLTVAIDSHSVSTGEFPPRPDFVRMAALQGRWEFRPLGDGRVRVTMSGHVDPGGHIPHFLVNLIVQEAPYRTLLGLRRMIAAPKYQQARLDGIRELP